MGRAQPTEPEVAQLRVALFPREGCGGLLLSPTGRHWEWVAPGVRVGGCRTVAEVVAAGVEASRPLPGDWARLGPQEITIITK